FQNCQDKFRGCNRRCSRFKVNPYPRLFHRLTNPRSCRANNNLDIAFELEGDQPMRAFLILSLGLLALVGCGSIVRAQSALVGGPGGGGVVKLGAVVSALGGRVPLLLGAAPPLPAVFPSNLLLNVGFEFLRPVFPGRSVTLTVPTGVNGNVTSLGGS